MFILTSAKLVISTAKYVLHTNGTHINNYDSIFAFTGEIIVTYKEGKEWVKPCKEHLSK